ncbi:MAG: hypothetical protein A2091_03610 [Desulfuromonadales bacterium GWD2_61_12]|nr:MAG: hypothetical protein A2091_03610 [Desulfuromonadales bacterium GWD2_61_12]OGR33506.1 MAG: hypothetical protein A2005_08060 [Desulfuromonadales bacterium GWC2_61_20]HAD05496.1 hybrid sensor histidine kinase/response regulator [Desulfuromonas sp.]HBT82963.1 hybrid sensor histidine kinase/response regulator [Desulfuromonas sp.]
MNYSLRILHIEDNAGDVDLIREMLTGTGRESFSFASEPRLATALNQVRGNSIDLALLDLGLPDSSGLDSFIRLRDTAPELPVIILTGNNDQEAAVAAVKEGAQDFLVKGEITANLLVRAIRYAIERKRAKSELHKLNAELEQRVASRTSELAVANRELEAFAYSVSHDLRAPLRAIDGFSRILLEDYAPQLDAEGQRICTVISDSTRRMNELMNALLAFSRLGRAELRLAPVEMTALAEAVFGELTTQAERARIDFRLHPLPRVAGDPALLRQVWVNLLANAIKFSAKKERATISVDARSEGTEYIFSVQDNGAGFDMRYADKLFGIFQRLHSDKEFAGTGIGLSIVQRIVQRHGGRVWGESAPEAGAIFYFTLKQ